MGRPFGYNITQETKNKIRNTKKALGLKPVPYVINPDIVCVCKNCKKEFTVINSRKNTAKFCNVTCYKESLKGKPVYGNGIFKAKSYGAYHYKVRKLRGTPSKCEVCNTTTAKKFEWANLTGNYPDIMDYKRMCTKCHAQFDNKIENIIKNK